MRTGQGLIGWINDRERLYRKMPRGLLSVVVRLRGMHGGHLPGRDRGHLVRELPCGHLLRGTGRRLHLVRGGHLPGVDGRVCLHGVPGGHLLGVHGRLAACGIVGETRPGTEHVHVGIAGARRQGQAGS